MKYPRILAALRSARWAVTPETLQAIRDALSARLQGHLVEIPSQQQPAALPPLGYEMAGPGIAVVEMHGIIGRNLSSLEMDCGGCDLGAVEDNLRAALADLTVSQVVLDIDSPGGTVGGVAEFSEKIEQLSTAVGKPVWAYASGMCCSAAYWIACGCTGIACSPSSDVGSIGVYMALVDESENWEKDGYKLILIKSGAYKAAGIAGSKVTPEQIALWQEDVDHIYSQFVEAVKAARPGIKDVVMQGQSFYGDRALAEELVDELCPDLEALVAEITPAPAALG